MNDNEKKKGLSVSTKSFITAIAVIFALMVAAYILTLFIPSGTYGRITDAEGNEILDTGTGFKYTDGGIPFWKWLLSPFLVLGASGSGTIIAVIAFLLVIGGVFAALDKCGLTKYMLDKMAHRFGETRYRLMALLILFFMALGAMIGSFEECVPLVPIVVALSVRLGWDAITGVGMSLLAVGCGFASGISNPFTVGVAQELAGLPMFSGAWLRILSFVLMYALLFAFVCSYSKKIERPVKAAGRDTFSSDPKMDRGTLAFVLILGVGILAIISSGFFAAIRDYTMIIVAVTFLAAGVSSSLICGLGARNFGKTFLGGVLGVLPAVIMILMASSIKYTLEEAKVLDTVLFGAVGVADEMPRWCVILFIYLIVLVANFFIPSGSAKAFMLIPLIVPMAAIFGISAQLCIVAFAFGDGFSNVIYPTNPVLLIGLGVADVSYGKWFKWSWTFQVATLAITTLILLFGLWVGY